MKITCVAALLLLAGCSYPVSSASTVDTRPHLSVSNAPPGAVLIVDNVSVGPAAYYAPDKMQLALDHGTHHVVIRSNATILFDNSVYLGDATNRTINLPH